MGRVNYNRTSEEKKVAQSIYNKRYYEKCRAQVKAFKDIEEGFVVSTEQEKLMASHHQILFDKTLRDESIIQNFLDQMEKYPSIKTVLAAGNSKYPISFIN